MRITEIIDLARAKSKTNTTTFSNIHMLLYFKAILPQFQDDIEKANEDYMGSIETRDLRATGTGVYTFEGAEYPTREYNLPNDMIPRIKFVQAKLNGVDWIRLKEYDMNEIKIPFKEEYIKETFNNLYGVAGYEIFRGSLFLLTGEIENDVTDGLELFAYSYTQIPDTLPEAKSDADVDLSMYGIPESMQELFAIALSKEWKNNLEVPVPLTEQEQLFPIVYKEKLRGLKKLNRDKELTFAKPADGYGKGFNL